MIIDVLIKIHMWPLDKTPQNMYYIYNYVILVCMINNRHSSSILDLNIIQIVVTIGFHCIVILKHYPAYRVYLLNVIQNESIHQKVLIDLISSSF